MVPENVVALAQAISMHYTGKDEGAIMHISTAAAFINQLSKLGWHVAPGDGLVKTDAEPLISGVAPT